MHFVGHVDQLWHDDFLILLMIDADESGVIAQIEKCRFVILFGIKHINETRFLECRGASRSRDRNRRRVFFELNLCHESLGLCAKQKASLFLQ